MTVKGFKKKKKGIKPQGQREQERRQQKYHWKPSAAQRTDSRRESREAISVSLRSPLRIGSQPYGGLWKWSWRLKNLQTPPPCLGSPLCGDCPSSGRLGWVVVSWEVQRRSLWMGEPLACWTEKGGLNEHVYPKSWAPFSHWLLPHSAPRSLAAKPAPSRGHRSFSGEGGRSCEK